MGKRGPQPRNATPQTGQYLGGYVWPRFYRMFHEIFAREKEKNPSTTQVSCLEKLIEEKYNAPN